MNKRIKELIEQAHEQRPIIVWDLETYQLTHKIDNDGVPMYRSELNPEKFAELILQECLVLFENAKVNQEDDVDYGLEEAKNIIKEHFGVEE